MKKYQQLRSENFEAAKTITKILKSEKCISQANIIKSFQKLKGLKSYESHYKNFETIFNFLFDHGIITKENINGLVIYVATQKCFRTNMENMFVEYQEVPHYKIDEAFDYVETNNNLIGMEDEANVVGQNILLLKGKVLKTFISTYCFLKPELLLSRFNKLSHYANSWKYITKYAIREIKEIKVK